MFWALSQDYNEVIQDPASCFADPELRQGQPVTNPLGLPLPCSGSFADVYQIRTPQGSWAVKCFTRHVPGLPQRYQAISEHLERVQLPFMVSFKFLEQGIKVQGQWFPVVKMHWVEGLTLNQFVQEQLDKPALLDTLAQLWVKLSVRLAAAGVAHGDLQHGNILLVPGSRAAALAIRLVDYDGLCVPALAQQPSSEVGHPCYQHPQRLRGEGYGMHMDCFSELVIYTALRALYLEGRQLWDKYNTGDNLLFTQADLAAPAASALLQELRNNRYAELRQLAEILSLAASRPIQEVPALEDVLAARPTRVTVAPRSTTLHSKRTTAVAPSPAPASNPADTPATTPSVPPKVLVFPPRPAAPRRLRDKTRTRRVLFAGSISLALALLGGGLIWFLASSPPAPEKQPATTSHHARLPQHKKPAAEGTPSKPQPPAAGNPVPIPMPPSPKEGLILHVDPAGSGKYHSLEDALAHAPEGATLQLAPGDYRLPKRLIFSKAVNLVGAGKDKTYIRSSEKECVVRFQGQGTCHVSDLTFEHVGALSANVVEVLQGKIVFQRCSFRGGKHLLPTEDAGNGLSFQGEVSGWVQDCTAENNSKNGIEIGGTTRIHLQGNLCQNNGQDGIRVEGRACPYIENNMCRQNKRNGITYWDQANGTVIRNKCLANEGEGIHVRMQARPGVTENHCAENKKNGIQVSENALALLQRNICQANGMAGIYLTGEVNSLLAENICKENQDAGILYEDHARGRVRKNRYQGNAASGICIAGQAFPSLEDNLCNDNARDGIEIIQLAHPTLYTNTCEKNGRSGITCASKEICELRNNNCQANRENGLAVLGEARPLLQGNTCSRNQKNGICYYDRAEGAAKNNTSMNNDGNGIWITNLAAPDLQGNICQENKQSGICYAGKARGTARRNQCRANEADGIGVQGQAAPLLLENTCSENQQYGLSFCDLAAGKAQGNTCTGNTFAGILLAGQAQPLLEKNICRKNRQQGICYTENSTGEARQNICQDNAEDGICIQDQAQPNLLENTCLGNGRNGICLASQAASTLEKNTCKANQEHGIFCKMRTSGVLRNNNCQDNGQHGICILRPAKIELDNNDCSGNRQKEIVDGKMITLGPSRAPLKPAPDEFVPLFKGDHLAAPGNI